MTEYLVSCIQRVFIIWSTSICFISGLLRLRVRFSAQCDQDLTIVCAAEFSTLLEIAKSGGIFTSFASKSGNLY